MENLSTKIFELLTIYGLKIIAARVCGEWCGELLLWTKEKGP
jgi:hypothetical protein